MVKNSPANSGDADFDSWVGKTPLEKEMATHFSVLAWKIPWTEDPVGGSPCGCKELDMNKDFEKNP